MTKAPYFYSYFSGHGRELLAETLGDAHPFTLSGSEIVERMLAAGYKPDPDQVWLEPLPTSGSVSVVHREGQTFIVSIDTEAETITVEEQRTEAYEREG